MASNRRNSNSLLDNLQGVGRQFGILANKGVAAAYEAGAYRFMSNQVMLITTTGRKTSRLFTTPLGYVEGSQYVYAVTRGGDQISNWFKNVEKNPRVKLQIGERVLTATGEVLQDPDQIKQVLRLFLQHRPNYQRFLGVGANASDAELDKVVLKWRAVRFQTSKKG